MKTLKDLIDEEIKHSERSPLHGVEEDGYFTISEYIEKVMIKSAKAAIEGTCSKLEDIYHSLVNSNSPYCDEWSTPAINIKLLIKHLEDFMEGIE